MQYDRLLVRVGVEDLERPPEKASGFSLDLIAKTKAGWLLYLQYDREDLLLEKLSRIELPRNVAVYATKTYDPFTGVSSAAFYWKHGRVVYRERYGVRPSRKVLQFWADPESHPHRLDSKTANRLFKRYLETFYLPPDDPGTV